MNSTRIKLAAFALTACAGIVMAEPPASGPASKPTASAPAGNVAQGLLVAKGEDWISVKGKDDKATRYTTDDKELIAAIAKLTVPSQVKVTFKAEGEARKLVSVQTVSQLTTEGVLEAVITAKGEKWIEAKPAAGDAPAERYLTYGEANEVIAAMAAVKVGDKVKITWKHIERKRVMKLEKLGE